MIITVCKHLTKVSHSFKSGKLKDELELHQVELTKQFKKPFEPKFIEHIIVEQTEEDLI